ncbi:MFS transporter [Amycolatopsis sp. K13G38]|uniref:MFS transporter n=1 Tax=Amycolatopsis acididurans TaxID=2724524 RepID=A0ABX1J2W8_9PSEU|nr:MFS transporter [Amycolatopsis acididurans]NKQ53999.1 MFS transporter [Amycolatopsis acididurans]
MTEYTAKPEPRTVPEEDSGRLTEASRGRLIGILVTLVLFTEIVPLQIAMVTMILPQIGRSFPESGSSTSWAITILGVASGATMALVGKAADLYGKKRLLLVCSGLFVLGSLTCALTASWPLFLAGRGVASVSWGMAVVNYGIIRDLFPRRWIPIAVGFIGTGLGVASIIGPVVCGLLTDSLSWRSVFWFLVIYMLVMIPVLAWVVPESEVRVRQRFDVLGALLFGGGVGVTLIYLSEGGTWGWTAMKSLGFLLGGLFLLVLFVLWERRVDEPMMELSLLRSPVVLIVMVASFFFTGVQSLIAVLTAYLFETPSASELHHEIAQGVAAKAGAPASIMERFITLDGDVGYAAGYSVLELALRISVWIAVFTMIFGPVGGYIARRIGARIPMIVAGVSVCAACALWINWHSTWQEQVSIGLLLGLGSGFFFAAWPNLVMDAVPASRQGVSTGVVQVFGGVGTSVSTALLASVLASYPLRMTIAAPGAQPVTTTVPQVYTDAGFSQAYLLLGALPCAAVIVLALVLRAGRVPARGGEPLV